MSKYGWAKHVKTKKHRIACEDIVVAKLRYNASTEKNWKCLEVENSLHVIICVFNIRGTERQKNPSK